MKERDLMIGDLVTYTGDDEGPIIASIEGINEDSDFGIEILGTCERIDEIEPIQLNEDILKQNGFDDKYHYLVYDFSEGSILEPGYISNYVSLCKWDIKDGIKVFVCGIMLDSVCILNLKISYVHELQHALRLCGLDELADNFKI